MAFALTFALIGPWIDLLATFAFESGHIEAPHVFNLQSLFWLI